ncbi:MAG: glycoside hydrolase family 57 protein [Bacillota bacterium]
MTLGHVSLVLHAHLPFVRHPDREDYLEERWLHEAVCECYLPLLESLERLAADGIPFRFTLSLSPTLMAMLDDPLLRHRTRRWVEASVALAEREVAHTEGTSAHPVARFYLHRMQSLHHLYTERYHGDLLTAFHNFARAGYLDLITCAATHGFLPSYEGQPAMVRAQIQVATEVFRSRFGHAPRGFWLPECGYFPGVDRFLREAGIQYAFVDTHGLAHARPAPPMGPYAHAWTPSGLALFGRDPESSKQVWSANEGYPGDSAYREFYRDIGFERESEHLGLLAGPDGIRTFSGFKYYKVTGPTDHKELYDRWAAEQTAIRHAAHFVQSRAQQVAYLRGLLPEGPPPLVVAPYDAELFGHWWFEGPYFLEQVARAAQHHHTVRFITPGDYIDMHGAGQGVAEPGHSSWGYQGYADFWVDGANHWLYRHLHAAGRQMERLATAHRGAHPPLQRALNQAARELLLAQASDWPFILRTGTATQYAHRRVHQHLGRFRRIADHALRGELPNPAWLAQVEAADNLFPQLDYRIYAH